MRKHGAQAGAKNPFWKGGRVIASNGPTAAIDPTMMVPWPLAYVWLGVSVEDQATADARIPWLLRTPAAVRFVSYEPALAAVDFTRIDYTEHLKRTLVEATRDPHAADSYQPHAAWLNALTGEWFDGWDSGRDGQKLDWLIIGAESGPGARPMDEAWARSARDQCLAARVAFFYKQKIVDGKKIGTPELDGQRWTEFPQCPDRE